MIKMIRKIGNSQGVFFDKEDMETYKFKIGDMIELKSIEKRTIVEREEIILKDNERRSTEINENE